MVEIIQIDNCLYKTVYIENNIKRYNEIWSKIKDNKEILTKAIQVTKNKFNTGDTLLGITIADLMLINYRDIDNNVYQQLINTIYNNQDIARTVLDGASNGGYSFLLMSLWNHKIKLTEKQKQFVVSEAMYKIGTVYWHHQQECFSKKLTAKGITDEKTVFINLDGFKTPIGQKTQSEYLNYLINSLGNEQAHGVGCYDIRYCILRNPNWTKEEKRSLINDFWYDDENYADTLEEWEWGIINDSVNYQTEYTVELEKDYLYQYCYQDLFKFYNSKKDADKIWEEINFCRQMHQLRKPYWKKTTKKKKILK